jgi:hypothetical protein
MMFSTTTVLAAMLALAPMTANAHMIMALPVPYSKDTLNNSPLAPSGADFPCKLRENAFQIGTMNNWTVGSTQKLAFSGSAVHGGGSCQVSVSTDKEPSKASKWKVIYSIEGNCPPAPGSGPNGNYPEAKDPLNAPLPGFDFTVPPEVPNGQMSVSWTWFNKVGNREFYQNCGPVFISGGSDDKAAFDTLPDMAVTNMESINPGCWAMENFDYTFENPGKYVTRIGSGPFMGLCGGPAPGGSGTPAASQPAVNPGVPSQAPVVSPSINAGVPSPSQAAAPPAGDKVTSTSRIIVTVTASTGPKPTPVNGTSAAAPPKSSPPLSQAGNPKASSQAPAATGAPVAPPPAGGQGQACSPDGSIVCSADGKQFGICNWGKAVMQSVAGGTTCKNGAIAKRDDYVTTLKTVYA